MAPPSRGSRRPLSRFRRDPVPECLAELTDLIRRAGAGLDLIEDALAFLAIARRRALDLLEHDGSRRGQLLAALRHLLDEFAHRLDFLRRHLIFPDNGFGRELADLGGVVTMIDVV